MKKILALIAVMVAITFSDVSFAQCYGGRCYSRQTRVFTSGARSYRVGYSYCGRASSAPLACQAVETMEQTIEPPPCAPVETVAPCAPVESCAPCEITGNEGEYTPTKTTNGTVVLQTCKGGACPILSGASNVVKRVANMLDSVNATRARYGLAALRLDASLEKGAQYQAGVCSASGTLQHGSGVAEILAQNTQGIEVALTQWLNSPSHRALLLNGSFRYAGVGVVRDAHGRAWCAVRFR